MKQAILIIFMAFNLSAMATGTDIDIGIKTDIDNHINNDIKNSNSIKNDVNNHNANRNDNNVSGVNQSYNANQNRNSNVANGGDGGSVSGSGNSSLTMSNRLSSMGGAGGQGGNAQGGNAQGGSVGNVTNDGNQVTSSTIVEGDSFDMPSNSAYAPPAFTRMDCGAVLGAGYTNASGSGSLGLPVPRWLSAKIKDCEAERDGNWLAEMGLPLAAIEARCATRSMRARFGGVSKIRARRTEACVDYLKGYIMPPAPTVPQAPTEIEVEVIREVPVYLDCHNHVENETGYMEYNGETYKNVKRLKRVCKKDDE